MALHQPKPVRTERSSAQVAAVQARLLAPSGGLYSARRKRRPSELDGASAEIDGLVGSKQFAERHEEESGLGFLGVCLRRDGVVDDDRQSFVG
jgi:hypothetical protein